MSEEQQGLYGKYNITKADGTPIEGFAFVLRPAKDVHARRSLRAYALSCTPSNPDLARDLLWELSIIDAKNDCEQIGHVYEFELDRNEKRIVYGCGHCGAQWEVDISKESES